VNKKEIQLDGKKLLKELMLL